MMPSYAGLASALASTALTAPTYLETTHHALVVLESEAPYYDELPPLPGLDVDPDTLTTDALHPCSDALQSRR